MVSANGDWDWNRMREFLPEVVLDHLAATPPPLPHLGEDVLGWRWDAKREFRVSSAYSVLMQDGARIRNSKWTRIWSLKVPQRVKGSMQGFRFATPPAAVAFAVEADRCQGRDDSVTAVVDIDGSVTAVVD
ncbi:hypothetical protein V6N13_118657 [Hibiscus sabdariffa]